jgi:dTDP-4-amino-4,6-dideoxygalactose transaminase
LYSSYRKLTFKEIFNNNNKNIFQHLPNNKRFFTCSSARSGLGKCIDLINLSEKDSVLMPALTAEGAIKPFLKKKINVILFDVNENLQIDSDKIINLLNNNPSIKCIFIIHYLGFPQKKIDEIKNICDERNIYLIEDCAQSLFSRNYKNTALGSYGHISLFSLGKTIPVLDGAIFFISSTKIAINKTSYSFSLRLTFAKLFLFINLFLNSYLQKKRETTFFWKLNSFNKILYDTYYKLFKKVSKISKISFISDKIIKNLNYEEIINTTKSNINLIYNKIDRVKYKLLFENYDQNFYLLGVPIISNNRNNLKDLLRANGIFCTIYDKYWNYIPYGEEKKFPNTYNVLKNLIILPVSYKFNKKETIEMVETLNDI